MYRRSAIKIKYGIQKIPADDDGCDFAMKQDNRREVD
jgi:hypothetical protein